MDGRLLLRRRRRLVEACLALIVLCGISLAMVGQGHHPLVLSGGLLSGGSLTH